jgi:hypothetical protein
VTGPRWVRRGPGVVGVGYAVMVPRGWVQVPGRVRPETAFDAVVDQLGSVLGGEVPVPFAQRVDSGLIEADAADADGRVLDSYLTAGPLPDTCLTASVVVAVVPVTPRPTKDLDRLLLRRVARGATALGVGGEPAVLWDESVGGEPTRDSSGRVVRRRTALSRVTGQLDRLVSATLTVFETTDLATGTTTDDADVADALVELFDAMLTTVRWLDAEGRVITDR